MKHLLVLALPYQEKQLRKVIEYTKMHPGMTAQEASDAYAALLRQPSAY
jgi:hypothetical protein